MYSYNTRSSIGRNKNNRRKVETFQQQQQQQQNQQQLLQQPMPHLTTFVTQNLPGQTQIENQNHTQTIQSMPLNNSPSPSRCPQPIIQTPATQFSEVQASTTMEEEKTIMVKTEDMVKIEDSTIVKTEVKWPQKRRINKKEQKKRLNARMRRLVCPKSPLMVFSELYKDVAIKLEERQTQTQTSYTVYTASIEIDGNIYTGDHVSKTQAKQKACENLLRVMLAKKISERPEKKEESYAETEMEDGENGTSVKSKGPPQEDFPWPHFASLAMHNLIAHWELQPAAKVAQEETNTKIPTKASGMKKFPENPENYNPVQLLHQMKPGTKFSEKTVSSNPAHFQITCEINGGSFTGEGSTKKAAKKECAIAIIKQLWNFDFNAIEKK